MLKDEADSTQAAGGRQDQVCKESKEEARH